MKCKLQQTSRKRSKSETNTTGAEYQLLTVLEDHFQPQLQGMKASQLREWEEQSAELAMVFGDTFTLNLS